MYQVRALFSIVYFSPYLLTRQDKSRAQALHSATLFQEFCKDAVWFMPRRDGDTRAQWEPARLEHCLETEPPPRLQEIILILELAMGLFGNLHPTL